MSSAASSASLPCLISSAHFCSACNLDCRSSSTVFIWAKVTAMTDAEKKAMSKWDLDETISHYLLSQRLSNSTAVCLKSITTAKECWDKVKSEFSIKSQYTEADMLTSFSKMCCPHGGNVHAFLSSMHVKHELVAVSITMSDKEYCSAIIKSLPNKMSKFASGLLTAACVIQPTNSIDPNILIDHISEEADQLAAQHKHDNGSFRKGKQSNSGM